MDEEREAGLATIWKKQDTPWRRYGARTIDTYLLGEAAILVLAILLFVLGQEDIVLWFDDGAVWKSIAITTPLMWLLAAPVVAALHSWKGTTPGKFLFGLRVVSADDAPLSLMRALRREALVMFWGVGLTIPLVSLMALIRSYTELTEQHETRWDRQCVLTVEARSARGWPLVLMILGTMIAGAMLGSGIAVRLLSMASAV